MVEIRFRARLGIFEHMSAVHVAAALALRFALFGGPFFVSLVLGELRFRRLGPKPEGQWLDDGRLYGRRSDYVCGPC